MAESDETQFRLRVYLPTGFTCTLQLFGKDTFTQLRNQVWDKKSKDFGCTKTEARFRLYTTELFFNDNDTISKLVSIYPSFEGLGLVDRYSILLQSPNDKCDKSMRDKMKIDGKKPIFWQGYLMKCSKQTGKGFWKKQYAVFQNQTLMFYSNEDDFGKGKKASKYIAMGAIIPQLDHHSCRSASKKFPFVLDVPRGKGTKPGIHVFAGVSEAVRRSFIDAVMKFVYYRKCSMILNILPCLYLNNYAQSEGLFRIAGQSTKIKLLQELIDNGDTPDFITLITQSTLHNFTGLLKRQFRFMQAPIIPETHYEAFIDIGRQLTDSKRVEQLHFVIKSLPPTSVLVLSELFKFLNNAIKYTSKSKMGPVNFAIVIGPNILRTELEQSNPMKAIDDNKHMQTVVGSMIINYDKIFPSLDDVYKFDKVTSPKWRYGVIGGGATSSSIVKIQPTSLSAVRSVGSSGGFGLLDITKNIQGNNKQRGHSVSHKPKPVVQSQSQIQKVQLKSTSSLTKKPNIPSSTTGTINFRAHLKSSSKHSSNKNVINTSTSPHTGIHDWKSQMKKKKKSTSSNTVPPKHLQNQLKHVANHVDDVNGNDVDDVLDIFTNNDAISAASPKLPPPNPIEMMSDDQKLQHQENAKLLDVFQDFEEQMAQYDEEIDFKQSFAESIVSQIMDLADNGKIINCVKHSKKIEKQCAWVINAAKAHSEALQTFNQMLQAIYSDMEDAIDNKKNGVKNNNNNTASASSYVTPGGPAAYASNANSSHVSGGNGSGGLPHAYQYSLDYDDVNYNGNNDDHKKNDKVKAAADDLPPYDAGGLPQRYDSNKNIHKKESDKKVAKALFDYPGGYRTNELTFHRGTSLIITKQKEGWVYGHYELEPSLTGWFPKSYVQIISGQF